MEPRSDDILLYSGHEAAGLLTEAGGHHLTGAGDGGHLADREDGEGAGQSGLAPAHGGEL